MSVSKRLRYEILRRDNHTCRYCGAAAPEVHLEVDHVTPKTLGGQDEPANLVTSCAGCNAGKSSVPADAEIVEDVAGDALRWSDAMKAARQIQRNDSRVHEDFVHILRWCWMNVWYTAHNDVVIQEGEWSYPNDEDTDFYEYALVVNGKAIRAYHDEHEAAVDRIRYAMDHCPPMPEDWKKTAKTWSRAGLERDDVLPLIQEIYEDRGYIAWEHKWRYFAGCVWNLLRNQQAIARHLLDLEDADAGGRD